MKWDHVLLESVTERNGPLPGMGTVTECELSAPTTSSATRKTGLIGGVWLLDRGVSHGSAPAAELFRRSMLPILDVAKKVGLTADDLHLYGPLAKLTWPTLHKLRAQPHHGKLVLVSAMTPTKYG